MPVASCPICPRFWEHREGYAIIFLFAEDVDDSVKRARIILGESTYCLVDGKIIVEPMDVPRPFHSEPLSELDRSKAEFNGALEHIARTVGLAFGFIEVGKALPEVGPPNILHFVIHDSAPKQG
jgi:hypothetical protein